MFAAELTRECPHCHFLLPVQEEHTQTQCRYNQQHFPAEMLEDDPEAPDAAPSAPAPKLAASAMFEKLYAAIGFAENESVLASEHFDQLVAFVRKLETLYHKRWGAP